MTKVVLKTEIDESLHQALEAIARFDHTSPEEIADRAIRNLVEERVATRDLVKHGLRLAALENTPTIGSADVHAWLLSDEDDFPRGS